MNGKFILRTGKHAGKTIDWIQDNDPSYLVWVEENRPEMLKGSDKPSPPPTQRKMVEEDIPKSSLQPNLNFWNEGPDPISLPYLKKKEEESQKDLDFPF